MSTRAAPGSQNAGLTPRQLQLLRRLLEEQRGFRLQQLRRLRRYGSRLHGPDRNGPGDDRQRLTEWGRTVLADVNAALRRLDAGTFGTCQSCAAPIEWDRLQVVPQTRYCSRCHPGSAHPGTPTRPATR